MTTLRPPKPKGILTRVDFQSSHPDALAISCSDGRYTRAVEELARWLGHERIDTLTLPGGPALLNGWSASWSDGDTVSRATAFLVHGHGLRRAILVAHEGCGYYRAREPSRPPEQIRAHQLDDLRTAASALRRAYPALEVDLFFAHRAPDGKIAFMTVK
jgi:hypothetical protein